MNQFFQSLNRGTFAFIVIAGGILFIVVTNPPHTICDTQMDSFKKKQYSFLLVNPKKTSEKTPRQQKLLNQCKISNTPGGCYKYFFEMKNLYRDFQTVPVDCQKNVSGMREFQSAVEETIELLSQIAWGEKPPETYAEKFNWLDPSAISLFCQLKFVVSYFSGNEYWSQFQEKIMMENPGAKEISRTQMWEKSIFSVNCSQYP